MTSILVGLRRLSPADHRRSPRAKADQPDCLTTHTHPRP